MAKPEGMFRLDVSNWVTIMAARPTEALPGIGAKTGKRLAGNDITTVGELARADQAELTERFGPVIGPWLIALAHGSDTSPVTDAPHITRSRGQEVTFEEDTSDPKRVHVQVQRLVEDLARDLAEDGQHPTRVLVKLRDDRFRTRQHGEPVDSGGSLEGALHRAASRALAEFDVRRPVRLVGVGAELADRE